MFIMLSSAPSLALIFTVTPPVMPIMAAHFGPNGQPAIVIPWLGKTLMLHPGEAPGLGVDLDEALAAKYPYTRAYLPVNRLEDGTMYNW